MRHAFAAAALLAALAAGGADAPAAPFTAAFDGLRADLEFSRDNDFGEGLDKVLKKQQKAVLKSLAALQKPADDLADDLRTAGKVSKTLDKAFPNEFFPPPGLVLLAGESFPASLADALSALEGLVVDGVSALGARLEGLSPKGAAAVTGAVAAANAALGVDDASRAERAKNLSKAWKQVLTGTKAADRDDGGGGGGGGTTVSGSVTANGSAMDVDVVYCGFASFQGFLQITLTDEGMPVRAASITSATGVAGTGTFGLSLATYNEGANIYLAVGSGTLTLTTFDPANGRFAGSFSFDAPGQAGTTGSAPVTCTFDIQGALVE
jgi:hypothetical protein